VDVRLQEQEKKEKNPKSTNEVLKKKHSILDE
jgi:hypothetical protein